MVNFAGDKELIGRFVDVKITEAWTNSLQGELLGLSSIETANDSPDNHKVAQTS